MAKIKCPSCGRLTEEGAFCEKCGTGLAAPVVGMASSSAATLARPTEGKNPPDMMDTQSGSKTMRVLRTNQDDQPLRQCEIPRVEQPMFAGNGNSANFDDCPWVHVERDTMAFCVSSANGLLRLKVSAHAEGVEDLQISLSMPSMGGAVSKSTNWFKPKNGQSREMPFDLPPLKPGAHTADVHVQFVLNQRIQKFERNVELYVYDASEKSAGQIAESIVINITNDIKTGHASDVRLSQDAADVFKKFANNVQGSSLTDLLNLMRLPQRAYHREELYEAGSQACHVQLPPPPVEAMMKRITLRVRGQMVHLIADRLVTLGKNRENTIVTRVFDSSGNASAQKCERISKFHCTIQQEASDFVIYDGAMDDTRKMKPSSWGVVWQGRPVKGHVSTPLESLSQPSVLGFVGTGREYDFSLSVCGQFMNSAKCLSCEKPATPQCLKGRVPSILVRRNDDIPESYILLWSCLDLGHVLPACKDVIICHEQGGFSWKSGMSSGWLVPGNSLSVMPSIEIRTFSQYGL